MNFKNFFSEVIQCFIPRRHWGVIKWRILNKKIDRNQWDSKQVGLWLDYRLLMKISWEETAIKYPQYFNRLSFSVSHCHGRVLEIGCGIGTMTRWISENEKVNSINAIDFSREAIEELKTYKIPKVEALVMGAENISFSQGTLFDTVVLCEVLEHIYPDEEMKMLTSLRPYLHSKTSFIISTPIGWLSDAYHSRGFSQKEIIKHVKKYYGEIVEVDSSAGYSQSVLGHFRK